MSNYVDEIMYGSQYIISPTDAVGVGVKRKFNLNIDLDNVLGFDRYNEVSVTIGGERFILNKDKIKKFLKDGYVTL